MDQRQILEQYEATAQEFEALLTVENINEEQYKACVTSIRNLISSETDPTIQPILSTISLHLNQLQKGENPKNEKNTQCKRRETMKSTLQPTFGNGLKDVAGLEDVKAELRKSIILPIQFPSLFTGGRKQSCHILLYGPPGNGKSKIVTAIAEEAKVALYSISSADLLSSWLGESEKMIREIFDYTKTLAKKCIVFIDEIDSICRKRGQEADHSRRIKNQLLIELDTNLKNPNSNCIVLCATNCPWDIDIAFMRRFQGRIYVPLPDRSSRLSILTSKSHDVGIKMSQEDWETIINKTEGYSGSDLTNLVNYAIQEPISELDKSQSWTLNKDSKWVPCPPDTFNCLKAPLSSINNKVSIRNVVLRDFAKAVLAIPKTVSNNDIEKYKIFCLQDCPSEKVEFAVRWLVSKFPLVDTRANKDIFRSIHPYCAPSQNVFLSWPIGKQRAAEWMRAKTITKLLPKICTNIQPWSTIQVLDWCRLMGYTPKETNSGSDLCVQEPITLNFSPPDLKKIENSIKKEIIKNVNIMSNNTDTTSTIENRMYFPLPEEDQDLANFISISCQHYISKRIADEELIPDVNFPSALSVLVSAFNSIAQDLIRRSYAASVIRHNAEAPEQINENDVKNALFSREEFDLFTNEGLGEDDN